MATDEGWTYNSYSTHAFHYTVCQRARQYESRPQPCTLVTATVDDEFVLDVPCFYCDHFYKGGAINMYFLYLAYLNRYEQRFANMLSSHFAHIPPCCAAAVTHSLKLIVQEANVDVSHHPDVGKPFTATLHSVEIHIHHPSSDEVDRALRESFEEAAGPKTKPASVDSVFNLLELKDIHENEEGDRYENGWSASDYQCIICLDEIPTRRSSLTMECSHVFHENCLLQWLETSHVCPLCRYKMPTED